jgi:group I intron endonuclease
MTSVSGIYVILHKKSGMIYIGQAQNIRKRWKDHRAGLNTNHHHNSHLQSAWNKYGASAFQFKILERCSVDRLDEREQHYLNIHMPKKTCYNVSTLVGTTRGISPSAETRMKLSAANKARYTDPAERLKTSEQLKGHYVSDETRNKMAVSKAMNWLLIDPNGTEYIVSNLRQFCRQNQLNDSALSAVSKGRFKHHKGWVCRKIN